MKIITWNVNSIRARMERFLAYLEESRPDVMCLQETKVVDDHFPGEEIEARGYRIERFGQRTYNGVAILSKAALKDVERGMPGDPDPSQARVISASVAGIRLINVYVPNGSEVGSEKFAYKLAWLECLRGYVDKAVSRDSSLLILGDFNIAPEDRDVYDPDAWRGQVLFHPDEHRALREIQKLGLVDAFRLHHEEGGLYSWWDFRGGMFWKNQGLRIDLVLLSKSLVDRCRSAEIDRSMRKGKQPSDHAPVVVDIAED